MDEALRDRVAAEAEKHALVNALRHGEAAQVGAVMGPLMGENPDFREHGDAVPGVVAPVVERVNELSRSEREDRLAELAPELLAELAADDDGEEHPLPDLPHADDYDQVRLRLAPNPNGPWHIGNARMPAVIGTWTDRHDGWMLCRFDDTDPEVKRPDLEAYEWILADLEYLGYAPDEVVRASDRLETYYDHGRELIELGGAYACSCAQATFAELKREGEPCPHRDAAKAAVAEAFEAMIAGEYESGEMVLRVRTEVDHRNPALRDWVAFRMVDTPHPRPAAADYRCWPMLDFQSGIDDHLTDITHIVRGIDLQDSARRQQFVYDYFGWEYPEVLHWGKVQVDEYDVRMSTSRIRELVEDGELSGWDDPRAPTLRSLRRRGIRGEAVVAAMVELGTSTSDVELAMSSVYAANRELIDDGADRRFLVRDGVEMAIIGGPETGEAPVHPDHEDRGTRTIPVGAAVLVEPEDVPANGKRVWLKGLGCVRHTRDAFEATGEPLDVVRDDGVPVVHWVGADDNRPVTLRTPDGDVTGFGEPDVASDEVDDVVQFERVGFARIDAQDPGRTLAYFAHR